MVQSQLGQIVHENLSKKKKSHHKKGLVEWLKVQTLSSNPSTKKNKKKKKKESEKDTKDQSLKHF
jgi:hypothetical protein